MLVKTRIFGEIDIDESKIITFNSGLLGFEDYKKYTLLHDVEEENKTHVSWLQCIEEPSFALPVIAPFMIKSDYNPIVEDELLSDLGELSDENVVLLLTLTVPSEIKEMSVNLKAPIIINAELKKGMQVIAENNEYEIKFKVYDIIKKEKGEE